MIIFDLDTLADCKHRRHFVEDPIDSCNNCYASLKVGGVELDYQCSVCKRHPAKWKLDWQAFYEACDKDDAIEPLVEILDGIYQNTVNFWRDVQIWSGRCESVREKTTKWLEENILWDKLGSKITLKMRPIGDNSPEHELKERWLDEMIQQSCSDAVKGKKHHSGVNEINFIFDSDPQSIQMWRRRGIFVFDCNQKKEVSNLSND